MTPETIRPSTIRSKIARVHARIQAARDEFHRESKMCNLLLSMIQDRCIHQIVHDADRNPHGHIRCDVCGKVMG